MYSQNFPSKTHEQRKIEGKLGQKRKLVGKRWSPLDMHTCVPCIPITSQHAHGPIDTGAVFPVHDTEKRKSAGTRSKGWWDRVVGGWLGRGGARSCYLQWNATIAIGVDAWPVDVCNVNAPYCQLGRSWKIVFLCKPKRQIWNQHGGCLQTVAGRCLPMYVCVCMYAYYVTRSRLFNVHVQHIHMFFFC